MRTSEAEGDRPCRPRSAAAAAARRDRIEADHGQSVLAVGRAARRTRAAPSAPKAPPSVETNTSVCDGRAWTRARRPRAHTHARARSAQPVPEALWFAPAALAVVVAVCGDHDCALRVRRARRRRGSGGRPGPRPGIWPEAVHLRIEAVELELIRDPAGRAQAAGRSGRAIRVVHERARGRAARRSAVECRRQRRRRQRLGPAT